MVEEDRRIRRTKVALEQALIALAVEKPYDEITIQEITDRADIGYRTFFRHFSDKDELLKNAMREMMLELREITITPSPEVFANPLVATRDLMDTTILFQHVKKHSDLYRVLMNSDRAFIDSLMGFAMGELKTDMVMMPEIGIPIEILAYHAVSSIFSLVRWWVDNDMEVPVEVMGEYSSRLVIEPFRNILMKAMSENPV